MTDQETQRLALDAARAALSSDSHLDRPSTTIHLPAPLADALLRSFGWEVIEHGDMIPSAFAIYSPDGERFWHRDEALTLALTAEAFNEDPELTDAI